MAAITVVYGVACWVFLKVMGWGSAGLVGAGIVNMACRITWGAWFVHRWIQGRAGTADAFAGPGRTGGFWRRCAPTPQSILIALAVGSWLNSPYGLTTSIDPRSSAMTQKQVLIPGIDLDVLDVGKVVAAAAVLGSTL